MKKLVVLMSVSLMALGSYSFSIAMQEDYGFSSQDGALYNEADQLAEQVSQLSLHNVIAKKLERVEIKKRGKRLFGEVESRAESCQFNEKNLTASQNRRFAQESLLAQIAEVGGNEFNEERLANYQEERIQRVNEDIELDSARSYNYYSKRDVLSALEGRAKLQGNSLTGQELDTRQQERDQRWADQYKAENPRYKKGNAQQRPTRSLSEIKQGKQLSKEIKSGKSLRRVNAGEISHTANWAIGAEDGFRKTADALAAKADLGYHNDLKMRYIPLLANSYGLQFATVTVIDKAFKFPEWQLKLAQEYFKGPDAIEAGKIHAFKTGDILALIAYADYLDCYYKSNYAFTTAEWKELLKTMLMLYVRVAQDNHAISAASEFIDELIMGNFPIDSRFKAWKESLKKRLFAAEDLNLAQKAQENILTYLVKIWSSRMMQACNNNVLVSFEEVFDSVSYILNEVIDPANMPTPAVICCLNGKNAVKTSQELEEVFRMFNWSASEVRQEGLEIALDQIRDCQSWKEFMATILKIEVPAAK